MKMNKSKFLVILFLLAIIFVVGAVSATPCTYVSQRIQCASLTCDVESGTCVPCTNSSECFDSAMECVFVEDTGVNECKLMPVKDLAEENIGGLIGSVIVAIVTCAVAVLGGAGGGAILVGMFQVLMGTSLLDAVALSQATIVGQSVFNVFIQVRRHHPKFQPPGPTRPAVNYKLLFFWLPISLVGTMWGNLAGKVVPDWFRLALMIVLLSYILQRMVKRVIAQRAADKKDEEVRTARRTGNDSARNNQPSLPVLSAAEKEQADDREDLAESLLAEDNPHRKISSSLNGDEENEEENDRRNINKTVIETNYKNHDDNNEDDNAHTRTDKAGAPQFPLLIYFLIVCVFVPLLIANLAKNRWVKCSTNILGFWMVTCAATVYCGIIFLIYRRYLAKLQEGIEDGTESPSAIPFSWNNKTSIIFPILSVTAGAAASLFGLGGGLILSFLFLEAGLLPEEVSATSGFTTFIIALESLIQFVIQGNMRYDYCLLFLSAGIVATAIGQKILMPEIKKRGWTFLIVASLAAIMGGSMLVLTAVGIYDTVTLVNDGGSVGFGELCPQDDRAAVHHF